jgi:predicted O-methyltransferase YrrM
VSVLAHLIKWAVGLAPPEVWTTPAERECLARHVAGRRRVVEIGVWHAGTSVRLRAAMAPDATFYAIDPYEKGRLGFSIPRVVGRRELQRVQNGRVVWVRKSGAEAARSPEIRAAGPFDFVFVDDAQTYELLRVEWEAWSPLVAPGGVIALHDSRPVPADGSEEQTSVRYTQEVVLKDPRFTVVEVVDSVTVLERRH